MNPSRPCRFLRQPRGLAAIVILGVTILVVNLVARPVRGQAPKPGVDSPTVPADVAIPVNFASNPIAFFDDYSWRTFLALVWPGARNQRGLPDRSKTVSDPGPRVFETYKTLDEVFHNDGSKPAAFQGFDPPRYNPCGLQEQWGDLSLGSFSKFGHLARSSVGSLEGPLIAQNATYVRYLTAYNEVEFTKIVARQWYLRSQLPAAGITFDDGSIDVKSSWITLENVADPARFHTRQASVLDPVTGRSRLIDVGLVGLHIVQKTPTRPQWIWTTFEQVDNVPPARSGSKSQFTFHDGTARGMPGSNPYPMSRAFDAPTAEAFNVIRQKPIHKSTRATNAAYHEALPRTSVWRNYQLVMTQWPVAPSNPAQPGTPDHTFPGTFPNDATAFSNVTLETFDQANIRTGCMACHTITKQPTDFLWSLNDRAFPTNPTATPNGTGNPALQALRSLLEERNVDH